MSSASAFRVRVFVGDAVEVGFGRDRCAGGAEGRDLDDLLPEADVREPEAPADQAAIAKQAPHFVGRGVGRDVEVFRLDADQEVTDAAADKEALVAGVLESIEDLEGVARNLRARHGMVRARHDDRRRSAAAMGIQGV